MFIAILSVKIKIKHKKIYRGRAFKVETMQGLVKDIFELNPYYPPSHTREIQYKKISLDANQSATMRI